jgi:polyhydroxybutyrate depolymerase
MRCSSLLAVGVLLAACGTSREDPDDRPHTFGTADRPAKLEPAKPLVDTDGSYPLVMILHGYSATAFAQEAFFGTDNWHDRAFIVAPNGLVDSTGNQFWNADPACCDLDHTGVDDSGYLGDILTDILAAWPEIDPARVYIMGHSNGGFMAYRMACDHADTITGIMSLAGDAASDPTTCTPSQPMSVLHLHGTADTEVPFSGAMASTDQWAMHDGCGTTRTPDGPAQDLDNSVAGAETTAETLDGCPAGITVEQYTLTGSSHIPVFNAMVGGELLSWLDAHRRP